MIQKPGSSIFSEDSCPVSISCFYKAIHVPDGESLGTLFQPKIM